MFIIPPPYYNVYYLIIWTTSGPQMYGPRSRVLHWECQWEPHSPHPGNYNYVHNYWDSFQQQKKNTEAHDC